MNNLFQNLSAGIPSIQSLQPAAPTTQTGKTENSPEDIPHEELMQLCMKMNKRMQAMDIKGKELLKKKSALMSERRKLLGMIRLSSNIPINDLEDQDLDMTMIESKWKEWDDMRREHLMVMEQKIAAFEENRKTISISPINGTVNDTAPSDDNNVQSGLNGGGETTDVEVR